MTDIERQLAISTARDYSARIHRHLIPAFGHLTLTELAPTHIRNWITELALSSKAINNILIPLRNVFADAYQNEVIDRNPFDRIKMLPVQSREADPFSWPEIISVLRHLASASVAVKNYFQFAFATGLRTSELIALTWDDIHLGKSKILVSKARVRGITKQPKTKSGRRVVDLLPMAAAALASQQRIGAETPEVFYDPRCKRSWVNDQALRKVYWYPALREAGIRRRNPYQTRHTYASQLLSNGANPLYVAAQMGHKDWGMIRSVYGKYISETQSL